MSRPTTLTRRVATIVATTALLVSGLAAGAAQAQDSGSLGSSTNDPDLPRTATITQGNTTITREVVGNNTGYAGGRVTFRTTISATGAPDRLVTRIAESSGGLNYIGGSAKITYTKPDGTRTTEPVTPTDEVVGTETSPDGNGNPREIRYQGHAVRSAGWPISAATGATVVSESSYTLTPNTFLSDVYGRFEPGVFADVSDLPTVNWFRPGVAVVCLDHCSPSSLGGVGSLFGS